MKNFYKDKSCDFVIALVASILGIFLGLFFDGACENQKIKKERIGKIGILQEEIRKNNEIADTLMKNPDNLQLRYMTDALQNFLTDPVFISLFSNNELGMMFSYIGVAKRTNMDLQIITELALQTSGTILKNVEVIKKIRGISLLESY